MPHRHRGVADIGHTRERGRRDVVFANKQI